jgi:serine acetyltransferase
MIHVSGNLKKSAPTNIGNRVIIGVGANVHGCTLEDECEIGDMAQVLDGAVVKKHSKIAPGSVVTPGTVVPPRQLWAGIPAKFQREMTSAEINRIGHLVAEQAEFAKAHAIECSKGWEQIFEEDFALEEKRQTGSYFYQPLSEKVLDQSLHYKDYAYIYVIYQAIAVKLGEFEGHQIPGRILNSESKL